MPLPPPPPGARTLLLSRATYERIREMEAAALDPDPLDFVVEKKRGRTGFRLRRGKNPDRSFTGETPPFSVNLIKDSSDAFFVTVSHGVVVETNWTAGEDADAVTLWECPSRLLEGEPQQFPIEDGEAIFVRVHLNAAGVIAEHGEEPDTEEAVDLVVADPATVKSLNHIPTIQDGIRYFKLASLEVDGVTGVGTLTPHMAGSHIFMETGPSVDVILEDCDGDPLADPPVAATQILRMTFTSGHLAATGDTETARPVHADVERKAIQSCHYIDYYPE
jgi:hypothetical protein